MDVLRIPFRSVTLIVVLAAWAGTAAAQPAELTYGPAGTSEQANRGAAPVRVCPDGGSIAVGTTGAGVANTRVYAVRIAPSGAPYWERTYDIAGVSLGDTGESVVELRDGSGFVIAGITRPTGNQMDALLIKVDCSGGVVWTRSYSGLQDEGALDVVEARTGDTALGTKPGDLLVAGFAGVPGVGQNGLLFRTNAGGALIWSRRYDTPGRAAFNGLIEARPTEGTSTGDIVAVGFLTSPALGERGYVARVNGNNGLHTSAIQCAAAYAGYGRTAFESVVELGAAVQGQLVFIGSTRVPTNPSALSQVFLVATRLAPCAPVVQRVIGDPTTNDFGFDVQEVRSPLAIAPVGTIAITGSTTRPGSAGSDAFLQILKPGGLEPMPGTGRRYGTNATGFEAGHSLALRPDGFFIAGRTTTDFSGGADPGDLYVVNADTGGKTQCAADWAPGHAPFGASVVILAPTPKVSLVQASPANALGVSFSPTIACP